MWFFIQSLLAPKHFFKFSQHLLPWLTALFLVSISYGLVGGLVLSPADYLQGDGFRILYVHVPCAFLSLAIYAVMAIAAIFGLVWRLKLAFLVMRNSVALGAAFTFLALLTGALWGKPMWGTWWIWDARLTSELILLFLYISILLLQSALKEKRARDRALAILILVGFVDIPIIHYSVYWWNTLHQGSTLKLFTPSSIDTSMLYPLLSMIIAFMSYYAIVVCLKIRYELIACERKQHWLEGKKSW